MLISHGRVVGAHFTHNLGKSTSDVLVLLGGLDGGEDVVDPDVDAVAACRVSDLRDCALDVGLGKDAALFHNDGEFGWSLHVWDGNLRAEV